MGGELEGPGGFDSVQGGVRGFRPWRTKGGPGRGSYPPV